MLLSPLLALERERDEERPLLLFLLPETLPAATGTGRRERVRLPSRPLLADLLADLLLRRDLLLDREDLLLDLERRDELRSNIFALRSAFLVFLLFFFRLRERSRKKNPR